MFYGGDIFENDHYKIFFKKPIKKLNLKGGEVKKIKELVILFPKDSYDKAKKIYALFEDICEHVVWTKICGTYQNVLVSISNTVKKIFNRDK